MKRLILLTVLILTIGLIPFLLNLHTISYLDLTGQQVQFILEAKRMFSTGAPWWSWNTFSGDNFIAAYCFYTVGSPFVWIVCLFPASHLLWGMLFALYLKTIATSVFSYLYFRKMSFNGQLSTIGALLYTFSSFYICTLYYYHFCEPILVFPLLLIGIESVIRKERYGFIKLSLATFFVLFINFYFACGSLLIGLIYFVFRCWAEKCFTKRVITNYIMGCVFGGLLSLVILLPMILHFWGGARILRERCLEEYLGFYPENINTFFAYCLQRLKSLIMPTIAENPFRDSILSDQNWMSTECFIPVFGIIGVIAYAIKRRDWITWMIVVSLFCYISPLNGIFSLFTNSLEARWLYGLIILIIVATLSVMKDRINVNKSLFIIYLALIIALIIIIILSSCYSVAAHNREWEISRNRFSEIAVIFVNIICLCVWYKKQNNTKLTTLLVAICGTANLMATSYAAVLPEDYRDKHQLFNNRLILDSELDGNQKLVEYRYEEYSYHKNVNILLNRPGNYCFHSIYNVNLLPFREVVDSVSHNPSFYNRISSHKAVAALTSVKEVMISNFLPDEDVGRFNGCLNFVKKDHDFSYYTFDYYIPMGFTYDAYVTKEKVDAFDAKADSVDVPLMMLENLVINPEDEDIFSQFLKEGKLNLKVDIDSVSKARRATTVSNFIGDSRGFICNSDFGKTEVVFFSVVADKGFTATIDGKPTKIYNVNLGMSAVIVPAGKHEIVFRYFTPGLKFGAIVSLAAALILLCIWIYMYRHKKSV
ncbi:MAG: YfhO family protein [Muribaculaceae bacterium]|nr:YfhO family protein [Muribaculaceae bacterium]